jgi:alkylation response protein AidB-like acyl-CoA dehydrogenase
MAVEYAGVREQFGRLIGSFQAIKQKCADVLIAVEGASAAALAAGEAFDSGSGEIAMLAHLALAQAAEAAVFACTESIEVHGGIGFTWDHPAHLYYKRAITSSTLLGNATQHRAQLLTALGR